MSNQDQDSPDREMLSRLMDGEWDDIDPSACVARLCADAQLRGAWERFHLARDAIKGEYVVHSVGLSARIAAAVAEEPAYSNVTPFSGSRVGLPAAMLPPAPPADGVAASDTPDFDPDNESGNESGTAAGRRAEDTDRAVGPSRSVATAAPVDDTATRLAGTAIVRGGVVGTLRPGPAGFGRVGLGIAGVAVAASVAYVTVAGLDRGSIGGAGVDGSPSTVPVIVAAAGSSDVASPGRDATTALGVAAAPSGLPAYGSTPSPGIDGTRVAARGLPTRAIDYVANSGSYWVVGEIGGGGSLRRSGSEDRLNMFLSDHIENSPTADRQGLLPYSRLVGYDQLPVDGGVGAR